MEDKQARFRTFELSHVSFSYVSGEPVLRDITLSVCQGEKIVLLGANGSGKSTLLKIMDALIFCQEGSVTAFGRPVTEEVFEDEGLAHAFRRRVGFIFQNSEAQLFNSTVWDELAFGPLQLGFSPEAVQDRVESVMELLGLSHLKDRPPYKLSGGEKRKVAIASVLSSNPEVLLLDEPTNGLDPRTQRWLVDLLVQLNRAGKTIVTTTHDLDIVQEIGDRAMVFNEDHRLVAEGTPMDILRDKALLVGVNLVDERYHEHAHEQHNHFHLHGHR